MITVYGQADFLTPRQAEMSEVLHGCMQEVLKLPANKRAHRFIKLSEADIYSPEGRTNAYTHIEINLMEGRKVETIKSLIHLIFQRFETELNIANNDVEIIVNQQAKYCWGFRGMCGDDATDLKYKVDI